jgi:hypothetical protein
MSALLTLEKFEINKEHAGSRFMASLWNSNGCETRVFSMNEILFAPSFYGKDWLVLNSSCRSPKESVSIHFSNILVQLSYIYASLHSSQTGGRLYVLYIISLPKSNLLNICYSVTYLFYLRCRYINQAILKYFDEGMNISRIFHLYSRL